ncbi:Phosphatidylinositol 3-kinase VPS34, involved in signal transduction [Trachipleistophora hominis]|uniref:Phosphatidylinositol 3-kinase VPS34, involved in signal transduction n=1 Tax=Trachipleistophora hominis TaxID=72359 RepID=L7JYA4_TRAHO|nr:Phosphatidylinositol 3-kinase VPS34, involved in signal transduction [Trachipleistophora hominis]
MLILYEISIKTRYFNTTVMRITTVFGYKHTYFIYGFGTIYLFLDVSTHHLRYEIRNLNLEIQLNDTHILQNCITCGRVLQINRDLKDTHLFRSCCKQFLYKITTRAKSSPKFKTSSYYDPLTKKYRGWHSTITFRKSIHQLKYVWKNVKELMDDLRNIGKDKTNLQQFIFHRYNTKGYFRLLKGVTAITNAVLSGCTLVNSKYHLELFWSLRFLYKIDKISIKTAKFLYELMTKRNHRFSGNFNAELHHKVHQQILLYTRIKKFHKLCDFLKTRSQTKRMAFLLSGYYFTNKTCVINAPSFFNMNENIKEICVDDIWVYESYNFPIKISYRTKNERLNMLYKCDDNLSNDFFMLCVSEYVSYLLRLKIAKYKILLFTSHSGVIEMLDADTFSAVYRNKALNFSSLDCTHQNILLKTFAFCVLMAYLFGIGDRNDDNFLVTPKKQVLQIDYSYLLGDDPKPFKNSIVIPRMMQKILCNDELVFEKFMSYFTRYFMKIRSNNERLYIFFRFIAVHSFSNVDIIAIRRYFLEKIHLDKPKEEVINIIRKEIKKGMRSKLNKLYAMLNIFGKYLRK